MAAIFLLFSKNLSMEVEKAMRGGITDSFGEWGEQNPVDKAGGLWL
jgi:hypothetical protein